MKDLVFFLSLFSPYKSWLISGTFIALITSLASISILTLSGWFIVSAAIAGTMAPDGVAIAFNYMQPAAEIRALAMIRTLGRYGERVVTHDATFRVLAGIRSWFFSKLIPLAPGRLAMKRSADMLQTMTQDIDALDALFLRLFLPIIVILLAGGVIVGFIAYYSVQLAMIVLAVLLITAILIPFIFNRVGERGARKITLLSAKFKVIQIEILQSIAELNTFNAYTIYKERLLKISEQLLATQKQNNHLSALSTAITLFLSQVTVLITIVITAILFQEGIISGVVLVMLVFCILAIFELVMPLSESMQMLAKTQAAAKRIRRIANLKPFVPEPLEPVEIGSIGAIEVKNLGFRYSSRSNWVFRGINLHIPYGSKIAIIGESGAGKTTLLQLIMHFFNPQLGGIEYAGVGYKKISSDQLLKRFALLSQQTELFAATIEQNIRIAKPEASEYEINLAIRMAGLQEFVEQLPDGLNTWVGEQGVNVSGGEARRIALARVYLKDAPILLLDEPTEGLDSDTENDVLNALEQITENKTLILVTHREVGLRLVDKVYKISKGRLFEVEYPHEI